jgi:DNA-binding response OmpR family regulator
MEQIKILLVDDEEEFVTTLSDRMQIKDLDSEFVLSGEKALSSLADQLPDVMVLDLKMPGIDGIEVLRRVKKEYPQVQVIILTGHGSDQDKKSSEDLGAFGYFVKPVDLDALIGSIKNAYKFKIETYGMDNLMKSKEFTTVSLKKKWSFRNKVSDLSKKVDQYQEAITFAQADQHEHARKVLETKPVEKTPGKLVVVGTESDFSNDIITYALEMAHRMEFEIVALNTVPLSCKTPKLFSSTWKNLCEEFRTLSTANSKDFQDRAQKEGIKFTHAVDFEETDNALEKLRATYQNINLVIEAPEAPAAAPAVSTTKQKSQPRQGFLVYAMS